MVISTESSLFNNRTSLNNFPTAWKCLKTIVQARIRLYRVEIFLKKVKTYIYDYSKLKCTFFKVSCFPKPIISFSWQNRQFIMLKITFRDVMQHLLELTWVKFPYCGVLTLYGDSLCIKISPIFYIANSNPNQTGPSTLQCGNYSLP